MELEGKRIAILAENNYQEVELWYPLLRMREAGAEVSVVGMAGVEGYKSKLGYPVSVDVAAEDAVWDDEGDDDEACAGNEQAGGVEPIHEPDVAGFHEVSPILHLSSRKSSRRRDYPGPPGTSRSLPPEVPARSDARLRRAPLRPG